MRGSIKTSIIDRTMEKGEGKRRKRCKRTRNICAKARTLSKQNSIKDIMMSSVILPVNDERVKQPVSQSGR